MPQCRLNIKVNAIVMLLCNLSLCQELYNGTRLKVTHMHNHCIQAIILTSANKGNAVLVARMKLAPSDTNLPFVLERNQLPLRLAYSMTIKKAQGQTFDRGGINLPSTFFSHGQLYVADSHQQGKRGERTVTPNVVFLEVLLS